MANYLATEPGETIGQLFADVNAAVYSTTGGAQSPEYRNGLVRAPRWSFALTRTPAPVVAPPAPAQIASVARTTAIAPQQQPAWEPADSGSQSTCPAPPATFALPDGQTATAQQMQAGDKAYRAWVAAANAIIQCEKAVLKSREGQADVSSYIQAAAELKSVQGTPSVVRYFEEVDAINASTSPAMEVRLASNGDFPLRRSMGERPAGLRIAIQLSSLMQSRKVADSDRSKAARRYRLRQICLTVQSLHLAKCNKVIRPIHCG